MVDRCIKGFVELLVYILAIADVNERWHRLQVCAYPQMYCVQVSNIKQTAVFNCVFHTSRQPMPLTLTLAEAIAKVQTLADAQTPEDSEFVSDLLELSAGIDPDGVKVYRFYYVTARRLQTNLEIQALSSAEGGVKFTGQVRPIETYLQLQLGIDLSVPLTVPPGFTAVEALNDLCGCEGGDRTLNMSAFVV